MLHMHSIVVVNICSDLKPFDKTNIPLNSYQAVEINLMFIQNETKINTVMRVPRQYLSLMSVNRQCACLHSKNSR